jgi:hypothetical protein
MTGIKFVCKECGKDREDPTHNEIMCMALAEKAHKNLYYKTSA